MGRRSQLLTSNRRALLLASAVAFTPLVSYLAVDLEAPGQLFPFRVEVLAALLALLWFQLAPPKNIALRRALPPTQKGQTLEISYSLLWTLSTGAFALYALISACWAQNPYFAVESALRWGLIALWSVIFTTYLTSKYAPIFLKLFWRAYALTFSILLSAQLIVAIGSPPSDNRTGIGFRYDAAWAELAAVMLLTATTTVLISHAQPLPTNSTYKLLRRAVWAPVPILLFLIGGAVTALILAAERAPTLAAAVGMVILLACCKVKPIHYLQILLACGLGLFVALLCAHRNQAETVVTKLAKTTPAPTQETNLRGRLLYWNAAYEIWSAHPLLGVGAGNFTVHYGWARGSFIRKQTENSWNLSEDLIVVRAHNEPIQQLAELGPLGLSLWLLWALLPVWRGSRPMRLLCFTLFLSSLASSIATRWMGTALVWSLAASGALAPHYLSTQAKSFFFTPDPRTYLRPLKFLALAPFLFYSVVLVSNLLARQQLSLSIYGDPVGALAHAQKCADDALCAAPSLERALQYGVESLPLRFALIRAWALAHRCDRAQYWIRDTFSAYPTSPLALALVLSHLQSPTPLQNPPPAHDPLQSMPSPNLSPEVLGWILVLQHGSLRAAQLIKEQNLAATPPSLLTPSRVVITLLDPLPCTQNVPSANDYHDQKPRLDGLCR